MSKVEQPVLKSMQSGDMEKVQDFILGETRQLADSQLPKEPFDILSADFLGTVCSSVLKGAAVWPSV